MDRYSHQLLIRVLILEGALIVIAVVWAWLQKISWHAALTPALKYFTAGIAAGVLLLLINYAVIEYGSRYSSFFRSIKRLVEEDVSPLFRHMNLSAIIMVALASGFAEELLFRGVVQVQFGLWLSSLVFGLAHIWKKTAIVYGIYASGIGVLLGSLYEFSGNLWVPICAHIVNNLVSLLYYVHYVLKPELHVMKE